MPRLNTNGANRHPFERPGERESGKHGSPDEPLHRPRPSDSRVASAHRPGPGEAVAIRQRPDHHLGGGQGQVFEQWGRVLDVTPHRRIQYSLFAPRPGLEDTPENYFVMTYTLDEADGCTRVTIKMTDTRPGSEDQGSASDGGQPVLDALKATAESLQERQPSTSP